MIAASFFPYFSLSPNDPQSQPQPSTLSFPSQVCELLEQSVQVVVGTPGRVADLAGLTDGAEEGAALVLRRVSLLVLDEADRMVSPFECALKLNSCFFFVCLNSMCFFALSVCLSFH